MHYYEVIKLIIITNLQKHGEMCMLCKIKSYTISMIDTLINKDLKKTGKSENSR